METNGWWILTVSLLCLIAWFYIAPLNGGLLREVLYINVILNVNYYLDYQTRTVN